MSRHFNLFERIDRERNPLQTTTNSRVRMGGRPFLPLDVVSLAEVEKFVNRLYLASDSAPRMVIFTAFEGRSGCSHICAHAGDLLSSKVTASVCLVDANLCTPSLHAKFGVPNHSGLSDLARDPELEVTSRTVQVHDGADLYLLPCGAPLTDRESVVQSHGMRNRIAELQAHFDFILIDAPPISTCRDALTLAGLGDGVVVVLRANSISRESARRMKQEIESNNVTILGAVLNDRTFPIPEPIYDRL